MALVMLNLLLALVAVALAFWLGGLPERQGGTVIVCMAIMGYLDVFVFGPLFAVLDPVALLNDFIGFLGFAIIGIFSRRIWPLWASSFQLLSVGAHFIRAFELPVRPIVYAWMKSAPTWAVLLLLIAGTLANRRPRRS